MQVILDSTVLIDCLRNRSVVARVDALWDSGDIPATTAINIEEIVRGLRDGESSRAEALFASLELLPIAEPEAALAGRWRRDFSRIGTTLAQADCLIAATTFQAHGRLATGNPKDFPMPALQVEHWPVGQ